MTWCTFPCGNRSVKHSLVLLYEILMASKAEFLALPEQQFLIVARVGRMAGSAGPLALDRAVDHFRLFNLLSNVRMTLKAKVLPFSGEHPPVSAAMGIVTSGAAAQDGRMNMLLFHNILHIGVACQT